MNDGITVVFVGGNWQKQLNSHLGEKDTLCLTVRNTGLNDKHLDTLLHLFKVEFCFLSVADGTNDRSHTAVVKQMWCVVLFGVDSTVIESSWSDLGRCIFPLADFLSCLDVSRSVFSLYICRMSKSVLYIVSGAGEELEYIFSSSSGQWTPWQVHQYDSCWTCLWSAWPQPTKHNFEFWSRCNTQVSEHNKHVV